MKTSLSRDWRHRWHPDIPPPDRAVRAPKARLRDRIEGYFVALVVTIYLKLT
ncbi:hypothetical protein ACLRDC_12315 [Gluconacetobacter sacchari]|uniref:Transposase n=2 Tax=Gluconacetobacter sacchari TaxID=92759 RepID=A0A7W4NPQ2_9PROT|nr:hypothetical protein [Gluconacetobacter sacchari]MBB2161876.1 hypothetical protein [Gluconacetobacter sacchari]GBQ25372.1 hypothetical protein AA12717_2041 [Gluconacetobacter sacchari DSM 12717]